LCDIFTHPANVPTWRNWFADQHTSVLFELCDFSHQYRICTSRDGRSGHDPHCLPLADCACKWPRGHRFANKHKPKWVRIAGSACVSGTNGKAVHGSASEPRHIHRGVNQFTKHAAGRLN
jgi:hypothetical protein